MKKLVRRLRGFGPYLTVAIFVPGGMVLAPLMWVAQRRRKARPMPRRCCANLGHG